MACKTCAADCKSLLVMACANNGVISVFRRVSAGSGPMGQRHSCGVWNVTVLAWVLRMPSDAHKVSVPVGIVSCQPPDNGKVGVVGSVAERI